MDVLEQKKDVLLAEDDRDDVEIFASALNEVPVPTALRHAENGDVLFVLLRDKIPYILFLDIHMPCRDGMSCIVEIRRNRDYDKLPVIMYTSQSSEKVIEECFRSGANLYLSKTNTYGALVTKLRQVFAVNWNEYLHYPPENHFVI